MNHADDATDVDHAVVRRRLRLANIGRKMPA
jgi:hypothetical protein